METESNLIRQIQDLDSDMQTLVYENYNKFIDATDTIRKMKTDFGKMEDKMGRLSTNICLIAENSACVSNNLKVKTIYLRIMSDNERINFICMTLGQKGQGQQTFGHSRFVKKAEVSLRTSEQT